MKLTHWISAIILAISPLVTQPTHAGVIGDVAIIGYQSDTPDGLMMVAINDITDGDSIFFWDSGYIGGGDGSGEGAGGGTWRGTEGSFEWTNDTGAAIAAGTVITFTDNGPWSASLGAVAETGGGLALSTTGDQVFLGDSAAPNSNPGAYLGDLLFGIQANGTWDGSATTSNTSGLPGALSAATANIEISPEQDNAQYTGGRIFNTSAELLTAVTDFSNWTSSNSAIAFDNSAFTINSQPPVTAIPEPGMVALMSLAGAGFGVTMLRRRKKQVEAK